MTVAKGGCSESEVESAARVSAGASGNPAEGRSVSLNAWSGNCFWCQAETFCGGVRRGFENKAAHNGALMALNKNELNVKMAMVFDDENFRFNLKRLRFKFQFYSINFRGAGIYTKEFNRRTRFCLKVFVTFL